MYAKRLKRSRREPSIAVGFLALICALMLLFGRGHGFATCGAGARGQNGGSCTDSARLTGPETRGQRKQFEGASMLTPQTVRRLLYCVILLSLIRPPSPITIGSGHQTRILGVRSSNLFGRAN